MDFYGTLGPACCRADILADMARCGMTGVRLNLSHRRLSQAETELEALDQARTLSGVPLRLLIDMQGPELRIGTLAEPMALEQGTAVQLAALALPQALRELLAPGQELLLDDGKLLVEVLDRDRAQVIRGGLLQSRKSVAAPGLSLRLPPMTADDREGIALAAAAGVTGLMQPFVRGREDLEAVRAALDAAGAASVRLMAKLESLDGLERLPELLAASDELVIARGDLGNAMPLWQLPGVQKRVARCCREAGRNFMVVTQMLASMEQRAVPTRAEVCDIFNAVLDGASSLMLTGETAVGRFPVQAMDYLVRTAREALAYQAG